MLPIKVCKGRIWSQADPNLCLFSFLSVLRGHGLVTGTGGSRVWCCRVGSGNLCGPQARRQYVYICEGKTHLEIRKNLKEKWMIISPFTSSSSFPLPLFSCFLFLLFKYLTIRHTCCLFWRKCLSPRDISAWQTSKYSPVAFLMPGPNGPAIQIFLSCTLNKHSTGWKQDEGRRKSTAPGNT